MNHFYYFNISSIGCMIRFRNVLRMIFLYRLSLSVWAISQSTCHMSTALNGICMVPLVRRPKNCPEFAQSNWKLSANDSGSPWVVIQKTSEGELRENKQTHLICCLMMQCLLRDLYRLLSGVIPICCV